MVLTLLVYRTLARDGDALGTGAKAAHLRAHWRDCCRAHLWLTRGAWRRAELGLSLHVDSRCRVHHLRILAVELLRRSHTLHGVAARPHRGESGNRAAAS